MKALLGIFCIPTVLLAQAGFHRFEQITIDHGLSQGTVTCILQGKKGFMWLGTQDGLNMYDGYKFTLFKKNIRNANSLSDNIIRCLFEDAEGALWVGTEYGLNKFDKTTMSFQRFLHNPESMNSLSSNVISSISVDKKGTVWVGTIGGGLNSIVFSSRDKSHSTVTRYLHDESDSASIPDNQVNVIFEDRAGRLWLGTEHAGLVQFDAATQRFIPYAMKQPGRLKQDITVNCIREDKSGTLWIGVNTDGLYSFNRSTGKIQHHPVNPNSNRQSGGIDIVAIAEESPDILWLATRASGLIKYSKSSGEFLTYRQDDNEPNSLSYNSLLSVYLDRSSLLWIGTNGAGINTLYTQAKVFKLYQHQVNNVNSLRHNSVRAIYEDNEGYLWVGTYGGLDKIDRRTGVYKHFSSSGTGQATLFDDVVYCIIEDPASKGNILWIGTEGDGLYRMDCLSERVRKFNLDDEHESGNGFDKVYSLCMGNKNDLWVGTRDGLVRLDKIRGTVKRYTQQQYNINSLSFNHVTSILMDRSGVLWVGTYGGGLNRFYPETETFQHYINDESNPSSISNNRVKCLFEDQSGNFWIGTDGGGLNKFDRARGTFTHYEGKNFLPSDVVYGILEDEKQHIWMSTNNGLAKFNPATGIWRTYSIVDGLQSNEFNSGACYRSMHGEMFFGGVRGFNAFFPENVSDNSYMPPIVITELQIFNKTVGIGEEINGRVILQQRISDTKELTLSYAENVFSFEFVALNYINPSKNLYAYLLEGFDNTWTFSDASKRFATYTNLDPGTYVFKVRGSNNDGIWNNEGAAITITVTPAFWKTPTFYSLAGLSVLALVGMVYYFRVSRLEREKEMQQKLSQMLIEQQEQERKRIAQELHDGLGQNVLIMKTNAQLALRALGDAESLKERLDEIASIADDTMQLSREIAYNLRPLHLDRLGLTETLETQMESAAKASSMTLDYDIDFIDGAISRDNEINVYRIIQESLNNILKHSSATAASVKVRKTDTGIVLTIQDNGKGFDIHHTLHVRGLGLVGIEERARILEAKLTIFSEVGKGTRISLFIPLQKESA